MAHTRQQLINFSLSPIWRPLQPPYGLHTVESKTHYVDKPHRHSPAFYDLVATHPRYVIVPQTNILF